MTRYAVGLGSNEGDRIGHLRSACSSLEARYGDIRVSSLYETDPVGGPDQAPFLNAVVTFDTDDAAATVLDFLQETETSHGRQRKVRWGPRTLDLDIVASDGPDLSTADLIVPHPRAREREFVLRPLADVWPEARMTDDESAVVALAAVGDQGVDRLSRSWYPTTPSWIPTAFVSGQFAFFIATAVAIAFDGTLPEGEVTVPRVVGAVLAMLGLYLAFVASRRLGPAMTPSPMPSERGAIVVSGPYRYVRHPIYGGVILVLMGTALFLDSTIGFVIAALLIPYFWVKSTFEENQLSIRYPEYRTYRQVVHRRLLPFVI